MFMLETLTVWVQTIDFDLAVNHTVKLYQFIVWYSITSSYQMYLARVMVLIALFRLSIFPALVPAMVAVMFSVSNSIECILNAMR